LLWFADKDILAGMADWLAERNIDNPGMLWAPVCDCIISNPISTMELPPEWRNLAGMFGD